MRTYSPIASHIASHTAGRNGSGKMMLLDVSATGEENLIETQAGDAMNDLEYRRRQLESLQERVIDLEDLSSGVSITDLTLNDLRLDLARLSPEDREAVAQRMWASARTTTVRPPRPISPRSCASVTATASPKSRASRAWQAP
ncbi:hypothetical protein [Erythrobacter donghaensis]|uniref:hypothetical protein n=1 Tax=Erythrobacter donghaensis TaxID=267135 RepID=UPI001FE4182B|nr:hypothetical protein [Erythrobacter donghaensis]